MGKKIIRSDGINASEKYLQKLCEKSFLRLWSYPGVFRDQSSGGDSKGGKEICDLLVVFENHVIIFSDKDIAFPNTGDIGIDWSRWVRKAILESGKQLYGAERWIREHPERIFIDKHCNQKFPINLPDLSETKFHRIIVAHGASDQCKLRLGGSGSLMILSNIIGDDHLKKIESGGLPFFIGQINLKRGFVHVFDDTTVEILLNYLDTISDFTLYLEKKEKLFGNKKIICAAGEEELLAYYLKGIDSIGEHDFIFDDELQGKFQMVYFDEGLWIDFINSPEYKSQKEANEVSYAWDALIEEFVTHILNDTQYKKYPDGSNDQEIILRFLARESRTKRRFLTHLLFELIEKTPASERGVRVVTPIIPSDPYYVFLLLPKSKKKTEEEYREARDFFLQSYCMVVKHDFPDALDIIGIATESGFGEYHSEDALYLNAREWDQTKNAEASKLKIDFNLLNNVKKHEEIVYEYPIEKEKHRRKRKRKRKRK